MSGTFLPFSQIGEIGGKSEPMVKQDALGRDEGRKMNPPLVFIPGGARLRQENALFQNIRFRVYTFQYLYCWYGNVGDE